MPLPAVALSALSRATRRGAPAWLLAACAAQAALHGGGSALVLSVAAALAFRASLLISTLLHEVRPHRAPARNIAAADASMPHPLLDTSGRT